MAGPEGCMHHLYAVYVRSDGVVQPCSGVDVPLGRVPEENLSVIIQGSRELRLLRGIRMNITGHCKTCELAGTCYGCPSVSTYLCGECP
ncbi:hypothetical protein C4546_02000 [Candidatus Parcubacteria bacterium]|nr:MAG: hypothetical protein C4546_02000 [Candidatus Parcubacteria bacterium]